MRPLLGDLMKTLIVLGLISSTLIAGCASSSIGDVFKENGLDRVAFETKCPKENLKFVGLNYRLDQMMRNGAQVGVDGCGKRSVYVWTQATGWVLNSDDER